MTEEEKYVKTLELRVDEKLKADSLVNNPDFDVLRNILKEEASRLTEDIVGDKYKEDQKGEWFARGQLNMVRTLFKKLSAKQIIGEDAQARLEEFKEAKKNEP